MSKQELKIWCWVLAVCAAGTAMSYSLPVDVLIFLMYLFVGILLMFTPMFFFFSATAFGINALISLALPKPYWLRIGVSICLAYGIGMALGAVLNSERAATFNKVAAEDVPLASKLAVTRLVIVDDRSTGNHRSCDGACTSYLSNAAASAVLFPVAINDRQPFENRRYAIYKNQAGCARARDLNDAVDRIQTGGCLAPVTEGKIETGDVIIRAFDISVPFQSRDCDCDRFEIFVQTPSGPRLIGRKTSFQMNGYSTPPIPLRDAGWTGTYYDHGITLLQNASMRHFEFFDNVLKDDLGF